MVKQNIALMTPEEKREYAKKLILKKKRKSLVATLMLITAVIVGMYPVVGYFINNHSNSYVVQKYDDSISRASKATLARQLTDARSYNIELFKRQASDSGGTQDKYMKSWYSKTYNNQTLLGYVEIPDINMKNLPIYKHTDLNTLDRGVGQFDTSSLPTGSDNTHSVLSGHSGVKTERLFSDVQTMKKGDVFYVHSLGKTFAYKVFEIEKVKPSQVDKTLIRKNQDIVTLLTCWPTGINTYRILVMGERVPIKVAEKVPTQVRNWFAYQYVIPAFLIVVMLVIGVLALRKKHKRKTLLVKGTSNYENQ
ncbi:class C sortase [Periweissella cryptocerci]|uniref:Class C sortase n=1 Tax=Periweissella cryptocerci TaxID=2506420 RepID=A0A4P6YQT5_9LACO|nr:class C sortase [Periweissella cryptocerci]QBO34968.1 class C sortase [Periweissella cryptocerci]